MAMAMAMGREPSTGTPAAAAHAAGPRPTGGDLSDALEASEAAAPVDAVEAVTRRLAGALQATAVTFLIADLAARGLVRLAHSSAHRDQGDDGRQRDDETAQALSFDDEHIAEVLTHQRAVTVPTGDGHRVLAPVTQRGEVIGVLEVMLPAPAGPEHLASISRAAHILAFVVIANRRHTDLFEWGQRTTPFELSAEIQRRLLPSAFTCEASAFTLSAWLEPAATNGGDTFDYSLDRDVLHLCTTDAMGHGVPAALYATVCISSLRNSRRVGASLAEQAAIANAAVREHAPSAYVTGLLGRIDLRTGLASLLNAGHVLPLLMRGNAVTQLRAPVNFPFGIAEDVDYLTADVQLQPGDRLVLLTDGMVERRAANIDLVPSLRDTRQLHPREATRYLADAVLRIAGPKLDDDATVLILDWHGRHEDDRISEAGADHEQPGD